MQSQNNLQTKLLNNLLFEEKTQNTLTKTRKILSQSIKAKELSQIETIEKKCYKQEDYYLAKEKAKNKLLEAQANKSLYEKELSKLQATIFDLRNKMDNLTTKRDQEESSAKAAQNNLSQLKKALTQAKYARKDINQQDYPYTVEVQRWVSTRDWFSSGKWKSFGETRYGGAMYEKAINLADTKLHLTQQNVQLGQKKFDLILAKLAETLSLLHFTTEQLKGAQMLLKTTNSNFKHAKTLVTKAEHDFSAINIEDYAYKIEPAMANEQDPITQAKQLIKLCEQDLKLCLTQKKHIMEQMPLSPAIYDDAQSLRQSLLGKGMENDLGQHDDLKDH